MCVYVCVSHVRLIEEEGVDGWALAQLTKRPEPQTQLIAAMLVSLSVSGSHPGEGRGGDGCMASALS
jgi:hypothetical protein